MHLPLAQNCATRIWKLTVQGNCCKSKLDFDAAFVKPICLASGLQMHDVMGKKVQKNVVNRTCKEITRQHAKTIKEKRTEVMT